MYVLVALFIALSCAASPTDQFDLTHWKLTIPPGATEISNSRLLEGYSSKWFYLDDGAMVFYGETDGDPTGGSKFARSELRELYNPDEGATSSWRLSWDSGKHVMEATLSVPSCDISTEKVIIGQVHSNGDGSELVAALRWEKDRLYLGWRKKSGASATKEYFDYEPGTDTFSYSFVIVDDILTVTIGSEKQTADLSQWDVKEHYFKAGAYLQSNEGSDSCTVNFYDLCVDHGVTSCSSNTPSNPPTPPSTPPSNPPSPSPPTSTPTGSGLVALYHFQGHASDYVGNNDGRVWDNESYTTGHKGKGIKLGERDVVELEPISSLQKTITLAAWVKRTSSYSKGSIVSQAKVYNSNIRFNLQLWEDQKVRFELTTGGKNTKVTITVGHEKNEWYHVAGTYDGSNACVYWNGKQVKCQSASGDLLSSSYPIGIGAVIDSTQNDDVDRSFEGVIDEVYIFNEALSESQVASLSSNGWSSALDASEIEEESTEGAQQTEVGSVNEEVPVLGIVGVVLGCIVVVGLLVVIALLLKNKPTTERF